MRYAVNYRMTYSRMDGSPMQSWKRPNRFGETSRMTDEEYRCLEANTKKELNKLLYNELLSLGREIERHAQCGIKLDIHVCDVERRY